MLWWKIYTKDIIVQGGGRNTHHCSTMHSSRLTKERTMHSQCTTPEYSIDFSSTLPGVSVWSENNLATCRLTIRSHRYLTPMWMGVIGIHCYVHRELFGRCLHRDELHVVFTDLYYDNRSCSSPLFLSGWFMKTMTNWGGLVDMSNWFILCATCFDVGAAWVSLCAIR